MKKLIVITRPREDAKRLAALLVKKGLRPLIEPMLTITWRDFTLPDAPKAVIVTSRHAVTALAKKAKAKRMKLIAVGDATAEYARSLGFRDVAAAGGTAAKLALYIRKHFSPEHGPLFYAAGADVSLDLKAALRNFHIKKTIVYKAKLATRLSAKYIKAVKEERIHMVLFFSERSAAGYCRLAARLSHAQATALCMSPTIARAARALRWKKVHTAPSPDLAGMLDKVLSL